MSNTAQSVTFYSAKYLLFFSMLFMTFLLAGTVVAGKIVNITFFNLPASTLLFAITASLSDVITEVYGYRIMRQLTWFSVACGVIFCLITQIMIHLPSPAYWHFQHEFDTVFTTTVIFTIAASIGMVVSILFNSFVMSKCKMLLHGRYFCFRAVFSSFAGECLHVLILYPPLFWATVPLHNMPNLIISGIMYRVLCTLVVTTPAAIMVSFVKRAENLDVYDYNTNFNPFRLHDPAGE